MPTYRELMDAAANADKAGDSAGAKRLVELASIEQSKSTAPVDTKTAAQPTPEQPGFAATRNLYGIGAGPSGSVPSPPKEVGTAIARFGPPLAAGVMTGGLGFLPAALAGVGSSAIGEAGAQAIEGEMKPEEIGAAAAFGAAAPVRFASGRVANFLANAFVNVGSSETGRLLSQKGEFQAPEAKFSLDNALRFLVPTAGAAISSKATLGRKAVEDINQQRLSVLDSRGESASVMLSEVLPNLTKLEGNVISNGSVLAREALENMDVAIGPKIAELFQGAPESSEIAKQLSPYLNQLDVLQTAAKQTRDNAEALRVQAREAIIANRSDAIKLEAFASEAAMEAVQAKYLYSEGINRIFGGSSPRVGTIQNAASMENLRQVATTVKESTKSQFKQLYDNVGIGLNDTVVNRDEILKSARKASVKGEGLEGQLAQKEFLEILEETLRKVGDETGNISLEGFRDFRDNFSRVLQQKTGDSSYASRKSSASYNIVKDAANNYISKNLPDKITNFQLANAAAADFYRAQDSNVIGLIADGKVDQIISLIKKEKTADGVLAEIDAYAASIAGIKKPGIQGRDATNAANAFKRDTYLALGSSIISDSLSLGTGQNSSAKIIDWSKLSKSINELDQLGLSPTILGFGTKNNPLSSKDIRQLARVASAGEQGGMTVDQFSKYIQDRNNFGHGGALARATYREAYRDYFISKDVRKKANAAARMSRSAKEASLDAVAQEAEVAEALKDPVMSLLNKTSMGLNKDSSKNGKFVAGLLTMDSSTLRDFVGALQEGGQQNVLDGLKKSMVVELMTDVFAKNETASRKAVDLGKVVNIFAGEKGKRSAEALRTILGNQEYDNFRKNIYNPVQAIVDARTKLKVVPSSSKVLQQTFAAEAIATGKPSGGFVKANAFDRVKGFIDGQRYNILYDLYVNPVSAPQFMKASQDVDKFIKSSAANSMAIRLASEKDDEATQQAPSR
jgi:hypothetical protein